jgi:hypothetical protein
MSTAIGHIQDISETAIGTKYDLKCHWPMLRSQLLEQWTQLTETDLDMTGPSAARIAALIEHKYGISGLLVENYLANFARTIPLR